MYKNDFSALAAKLGYEELVLRHIVKTAPDYYKPFHLVLTKNGKQKTRHIDSPGKKSALSMLQKKINKRLLIPEIGLLPVQMVGSIKGKDLFCHILPHVDQPTVVCMDLSNCFPNISSQRLNNVWRDEFGYSTELAKMLNQATTFRGYLPQGPATSPLLCNFALSKMSAEIAALCKANDLVYTQYVDDICISGDDNVARTIIGEVHKIVNSYGQDIKDAKTDIWDRKHQQRSARIVLNEKPKLLKSYGDTIVGEIRAFEAQGAISTGEKLHITGELLYLQKFSKDDASRIKAIFNSALQNVEELDENRPKSGQVKRCYHHIKNKYNSSHCKYL